MKQMILFTDLDDTLLDSKKEITAGNRKALNALLEQGHIVVISTGRALASARAQAARLGLVGRNCYIVCYNGGRIYDTANQSLIYQRSVPMRYVRELFDLAREFGIHIQTYSDTHVLAEHDSGDLQDYCRIQDLPYAIVDDVTAAMEHEPAKLLAIDYADPVNVIRFREQISGSYQGKLNVFQSHPALLEIVPPGVDKGNAVRTLCQYLQIPLENSVAAGDEENDLSMIMAAHIGAAMRNAVPLLKEHADYITRSDNDHDGVAEIIYQFILRS